MELYQGLLLISSIHFLAAASPGPDFVLVSQQTLSNGKKAGYMSSIGIALGLSMHIIYSAPRYQFQLLIEGFSTLVIGLTEHWVEQ